jgi:hypothetical protein
MYSIVQLIAASIAISYAILSILSALRMYFVHRKYVHIEFDQKKWHHFGEWAPRRLGTLIVMRHCAVLSIVALVAVTALRLAKS